MNASAVLQQKLGYSFSDPTLLAIALTHRSKGSSNYERLEFLGDSIIGFVIADILFHAFPYQSEGKLSRMRSSLVRQETLASIAKSLNLSNFLEMGEGELKSGGFNRDSILSDVLESIIGAIYLDGELSKARLFIEKHFAQKLGEITAHTDFKDSKSRLQERMQKRGLRLPAYEVTAVDGEEHEQDFTVQCLLIDLDISAGATAKSKRLAEQLSAARVLDLLEQAKHG